MSGPPKLYTEVIIVPLTKEIKAKLKAKAGRLGMSVTVRKLIESYLGIGAK